MKGAELAPRFDFDSMNLAKYFEMNIAAKVATSSARQRDPRTHETKLEQQTRELLLDPASLARGGAARHHRGSAFASSASAASTASAVSG